MFYIYVLLRQRIDTVVSGKESRLPLGDSPEGLSFPIALGLSQSDYYETPFASDTFGFFQFSAIASYGLPVPVQYGSWELSGGVNFLTFGDA